MRFSIHLGALEKSISANLLAGDAKALVVCTVTNMFAKLCLPLFLTLSCGGLLTQAGGSKLYRKASFWPKSDQTEARLSFILSL